MPFFLIVILWLFCVLLYDTTNEQGWRKAEIFANYIIAGLGMILAVLGGGLSIKKSFF